MRHASLLLLLLAAAAAPRVDAQSPSKLGDDEAPPPSTAPPAAAPEKAPRTADEAFTTRVKTLEEQVVDLKEKIFRSKARLLLLQETVLGGDLSQGAGAVIVHKNELSSIFALESVAYALDGAPLYSAVDKNGDLSKREELEVFTGRIVPGQHQLSARMVYRGQGFGVFSYVDDYTFTVTAAVTFNAEPGKTTTIKAVAYDTGNITSQMKDRAAIRFDASVAPDMPAKPQAQAGSAAP